MKASQICVYPAIQTPKWKRSVGTLFLPIGALETRKKGSHQDGRSTISKASAFEHDKTFPYVSSICPQLSPVPAVDAQHFSPRDVFLLMHFTSKTSLNLWGSQKIWIEDVMGLAFQV